MDAKEYFLQRLQELQDFVVEANQNLKDFRAAYIEENREFEDGDRVRIYSPPYTGRYTDWKTGQEVKNNYPAKNRFAYVLAARITDSGDIKYDFLKEKKNGEPSKMYDYSGPGDIIYKAEE